MRGNNRPQRKQLPLTPTLSPLKCSHGERGQPDMSTTSTDDDRTDQRGLVLVLGAVLGYSLLHAGFRVLASSSLGEEDPLVNLAVQELRLAYALPRPPLYEWLVWAVQQVTGPGIAGFVVIKYGALIATAGFIYASAMRVHGDRIWALLTVESLALIYQIAWRYHEGFAHEIPTMAAVAATVWAALRVATSRPEDGARLGGFVALGLTIGVGLLSTLTYWVFLASLAIAASMQPASRARLADRRMLVSAAIAAAVASPFLTAIATATGPLHWFERYSANAWKNLGKALLDAVRGPLFYLAPLVIIVPLMFKGALTTALGDLRRRPNAEARVDLAQLVLHQAMAGAVLTLIGAVLFGTAGYAMHQLMPLYLASVIWLMDVARRACAGNTVPRIRFARFAMAIAAVALAARLANMFVLDPVCKICRWGIPYEGLAAELVARGLPRAPSSAVVVIDPETGGNLRARLAAPHVYLAGHSVLGSTPAQLSGRPTAFVWRALGPDEAHAASVLPALLPPGRQLDEAATVSVPWHHAWRKTGYRSSQWHVLVVPAANP